MIKIDMDSEVMLYDVSCDFCSFEQEIETTSFPQLLRDMRYRGWKSIKTDEGWKNKCISCQTGVKVTRKSDAGSSPR